MDELPTKNRAEPHRRLLRHTYQEGPGFLFLATRGGRPPGPSPRSDLVGLRLRARCVRVAREEGIAAALALGASRASLHRWRVRYAAGGLEALLDRPPGPHRERLPAWVEQAVIVVRLLTYWNSKRLAQWWGPDEYRPTLSASQKRAVGWMDAAGCDQILAGGLHLSGGMYLRPSAKGVSMVDAGPGNYQYGQDFWQNTQEGVVIEQTYVGTKLVNVRLHPYVMVLAARAALLDPAGDGHYVLDRIFKVSTFDYHAGEGG